MEPGDQALVYTTWLKGLYFGNDWFQAINKYVFDTNYHKVIEAILSRPEAKTRVACLKDSPEIIVGYAVMEPEILHWVFVKPDWRKIGIAKDLVPSGVKSVTHLTKLGSKLKPKTVQFNPFL